MNRNIHIISKATLLVVLLTCIPLVYNLYCIFFKENADISILSILCPILNIFFYKLIGFFITKPSYLFKGQIDQNGNYMPPNPSTKQLINTLNYFYILRFVLISIILVLAATTL